MSESTKELNAILRKYEVSTSQVDAENESEEIEIAKERLSISVRIKNTQVIQ